MNKKEFYAERKAYLQPYLKVVEIDSSEILAGSNRMETESYSVGSNEWTNNDGEDEDFFNN